MLTRKLVAQCRHRSENPFGMGHQTRRNRDGSWTLYYAYQKQCDPHEFRDAELSILPIAKNGFAIEAYTQDGKNWDTFYGFDDWKKKSWQQSWGVQVYTGPVSDYLTDLDFEYEVIADHPDAFVEMLNQLCDLTPNPLLTISKSGGVRFTSRTPDYVHPNKTESKEYIGDYSVDPRVLYLEVFGEKGLSRYDARYEIVEGSLWDIPTIPKDAIFKILDAYRHDIGTPYQSRKNTTTAKPSQKKRPKSKSSQSQKRSKGTRPRAEYDDNEKPIGIEWTEPDTKGNRKSKQIYACSMTAHKKSDGDMRFYKTRDGRISQFCHNCGKERIFENPRQYHPTQPKLVQHPTETPIETVSVEENTARRDAATEKAIAAQLGKTHKTHITQILDATGGGKNYTTLLKAKRAGKRPIFIEPHKELADQVVEMAYELGYKTPFHLRGRGQNWHESNIAEIPVEERTEDLFEKNLCVLFDVLEEHTAKRLAPAEFCLRSCPFSQNCAYWQQYERAAKADALSLCTPNLLFDPSMLGFLRRLVKGEGGNSTEIDDIIDAALGINSEDLEPFDMAVIDDYTVASLYNDLSVSLSEMKQLKKNWDGYELGVFADQLLQVFLMDTPEAVFSCIKEIVDALDTPTRKALRRQLVKHPRWGVIEASPVPLSSKETGALLTEQEIAFEDGGRAKIAVDTEAYNELLEKKIPAVRQRGAWREGDRVMVPYGPFGALKAGVNLKDISPVWPKRWTLLHQLQTLVKSVENPLNAPIRIEQASELIFSVPPQASSLIPKIFLLSATTDPKQVRKAFGKQRIKWDVFSGKGLQWAEGVKVYQFSPHRVTSASTFEYPKDTDGKRKLQSAPRGLTPRAEKRFEKFNAMAKKKKGLKVFISYKEIAETPELREKLSAFDIVTHFDRVAGLNIDSLSFLVVYGYPKAKHEVVMEKVRTQHASDSDPLPKADPTLRDKKGNRISEYEQLTETAEYQEDGITITERRYKDSRLEAIRHQLATDKLIQAVGRARHPRWTDTETVIFTNAPLSTTTPRATLFEEPEFHASDTLQGMAEAAEILAQVREDGDVKEVAALEQVSERTAYRRKAEVNKQKKAERDAEIFRRAAAEEKQSSIAAEMGINKSIVSRTLNDPKKREKYGVAKLTSPIYTLIGDGRNATPAKNVDEPCLEDASDEKTLPDRDSEILRLHKGGARAEKIVTLLRHTGYPAEKTSIGIVRAVIYQHNQKGVSHHV